MGMCCALRDVNVGQSRHQAAREAATYGNLEGAEQDYAHKEATRRHDGCKRYIW